MTVRFQPGFGWKLTETTSSGICTESLTVSAFSCSFGTRIVRRAKLSAANCSGLIVTWAAAAGAATSASAAASGTMVRERMVSPF